jgi:hypothetical protein
MIASQRNQREIIELLLVHGADVHAKDKTFGNTALMWAAARGNQESVELLLERGAAVDAQVYGKTALTWAAENGHKEMVQLLLERGADVDAKNEDGSTALMHAASRGHRDIVKVLSKSKSEAGCDFIYKAIEKEYQAILSSLKAYEEQNISFEEALDVPVVQEAINSFEARLNARLQTMPPHLSIPDLSKHLLKDMMLKLEEKLSPEDENHFMLRFFKSIIKMITRTFEKVFNLGDYFIKSTPGQTAHDFLIMSKKALKKHYEQSKSKNRP